MENIDKIEEYFLTTSKGEIYAKVVGHIEKMLIEKALERSSGNQLEASRLLGINRNTLRAKIKKLNIVAGKFK
ncbi:MAG: helix-turn-helix domain-containing protein [Candidatus Omnitrophota bacterium]|nr:helix-turn-helix domain-containing protein [Candidatus Omnitrophota bacterium]